MFVLNIFILIVLGIVSKVDIIYIEVIVIVIFSLGFFLCLFIGKMMVKNWLLLRVVRVNIDIFMDSVWKYLLFLYIIFLKGYFLCEKWMEENGVDINNNIMFLIDRLIIKMFGVFFMYLLVKMVYIRILFLIIFIIKRMVNIIGIIILMMVCICV